MGEQFLYQVFGGFCLLYLRESFLAHPSNHVFAVYLIIFISRWDKCLIGEHRPVTGSLMQLSDRMLLNKENTFSWLPRPLLQLPQHLSVTFIAGYLYFRKRSHQIASPGFIATKQHNPLNFITLLHGIILTILQRCSTYNSDLIHRLNPFPKLGRIAVGNNAILYFEFLKVWIVLLGLYFGVDPKVGVLGSVAVLEVFESAVADVQRLCHLVAHRLALSLI